MEPISYAQAKLHCRLDGDAEQDLVNALIVAAREYVEDDTGLVLVPGTVVESAPGLGRWIDVSAWPVQSITSITYLDTYGVVQPVAAANWYGAPGRRPYRIRPMLSGWGVATACALDTVFPVTITIAAGYATPDDVPATVKQAILLLIGHWYKNREATVVGERAAAMDIPFAVDALLSRLRMVSI